MMALTMHWWLWSGSVLAVLAAMATVSNLPPRECLRLVLRRRRPHAPR